MHLTRHLLSRAQRTSFPIPLIDNQLLLNKDCLTYLKKTCKDMKYEVAILVAALIFKSESSVSIFF